MEWRYDFVVHVYSGDFWAVQSTAKGGVNGYIYIYPTECRVLHLLPLRYPERHFRRLPALETRCFESDSLTCFGRFGHFRPYKWFAGVVGRLEAILQHWTTGMTFLVILDIGCCFGLAWSTLRLWPVLAVLDMIGLFWPASVSQAILRCFRDQQCGCDAFTWNFWDFESIDNAKRWNACVMGVFLHPGSKAETAWFERNFIFFWWDRWQTMSSNSEKKKSFCCTRFHVRFSTTWNQFFHPNNLNKQFEASEFDRNRFFGRDVTRSDILRLWLLKEATMSTKMWKKDSNMGMSDSSCVFVCCV